MWHTWPSLSEAWGHPPQRVRVSERRVHVRVAAFFEQSRDQSGWQTVVVVGASRLHVCMVLVDAEVHATHGIVIPNATRIVARSAASFASWPVHDCVARSPDFGCARIEHHTIDGHAENVPLDRPWLVVDRGLQRHFKAIMLLADGIRIAPVGELARLMIGQAIGFDDALSPDVLIVTWLAAASLLRCPSSASWPLAAAAVIAIKPSNAGTDGNRM